MVTCSEMKTLLGRILGRDLCWMSNTKQPRNFWRVLSWGDQLRAVGQRAVFIRAPVLVKFLGKILQKWLRGMMLTDAPGSTLMWSSLLP